MSHKNKHQKLIDAFCAFVGGRKAICPNCGSSALRQATVELNKQKHTSFGAFWCEDCRIALMLCCAKLTDETRQDIVDALPDDLKYI